MSDAAQGHNFSPRDCQNTVVNTRIVRYVAVILQIEDGPNRVFANFDAGTG
jgi:hypothetical protein